MSARRYHDNPPLESIDGPVLVALGNWLANSIDVSELSKEQALLLSTLIERLAKALWREFADDLRILVQRNIAQLDADADDWDDPGEDTEH